MIQFLPKFNSSYSVITNTIYALIIRNILSKFKLMNIGFLWVILEPAIHVGIIFIIFSVVFNRFTGGIFQVESLLFTVLNWFLIRDLITGNLSSLSSHKSYLIFPNVKPILVYLSVYISNLLIHFLVQFIFFIALLIFFEEILLGNIYLLIFCFIYSSLFGFFLSIALATISIDKPAIKRIIGLSLRFLYIGSLVIFPIEIIPVVMQEYVLINPLVHIMEAIREVIHPFRENLFSIRYLVISLTVMAIASIIVFYNFGRSIE